MRFFRRSLTGLFLISLTTLLLIGAGYRLYSAVQERFAREAMPPRGQERQFSVNVVDITPMTLTPDLISFGVIQARQTLELRAPVPGRVVALSESFEEGGAVREGDVILQLDPREAKDAYRLAEADVIEAEAGLRDAERARDIAEDDLAAAQAQLDLRAAALERQQSLSARGVGSARAVEDVALSHASASQSVLAKRQSLANAETAVDSAKTAVLRAEIARDEAQRTLDDMTVTAAFDGVLSDVSGAMGALLSGNEQFATLIAPGALEVAFRISTEQYARLVAGQKDLPQMPVRVTLDVSGMDLSATGQVTRESAAVAEGQTGRMLYARLEETAGFRPGDFVTVTLSEPELSHVALLPATALAANQTVLVLGDQSRLEEIQVDLLREQGDDVIVTARTIAGRQVVTERSPLLGAGIRVRVNGVEAAEGAAQGEGGMVTLSDKDRARFLAFIESNDKMPDETRARMKDQLSAEKVPAELIARLESRMGS